jgi:2,3-bisphosphoglycerate-independent phosphoglycerate mutase
MKVNPVLLIILDGFGCRANGADNAIFQAKKPNWGHFWIDYPHTLIHASEAEVGLPHGQMGNSEVGHLNIGAGRVVYQEFTRINRAIDSGHFFANPALVNAIETAKKGDHALHIMGLLSDGGVHSHEKHIHAMLEMAVKNGLKKVYIHPFTDGRDTPPKSAGPSLMKMQQKIRELGVGRIASLIGRYYPMDRDRRWQRVKAAYDLLTQGKADYVAHNALEGLQMAYERGETDEFVKATAIVGEGEQPVRMEDGDVIAFMNFRSDRARQISRTFIEDDFDGFEREYRPKLGAMVTLTGYSDEFDIPVAFPPEQLRNGFGEYIASLGLKQLRIAETEKYAHVTFFFNGGNEKVYPGEDRILVPSPDVATYDMKPEMSAPEVTDRLVAAIGSRKYDAIICNYANADMVGHTGNLGAAIKAIETIDDCLGRVVQAQLDVGGEVLITADHGNAECMMDASTRQAHTAHTMSLVPFIFISARRAILADTGALEDVAPTMLKIMGLPQPSEMTGRPIIDFQ